MFHMYVDSVGSAAEWPRAAGEDLAAEKQDTRGLILAIDRSIRVRCGCLQQRN